MEEIYQAQVKGCLGGYSAPISFKQLLKKYKGDNRELMRAIAGRKVVCLNQEGDIIEVKKALGFLRSKEDDLEKAAFESCRTLEHFRQFQNKYPKGKFTNEARIKEIELSYQACSDCTQYLDFIKQYEIDPNFGIVGKVRERAESICFQEINSLKDCEAFRKNFIGGNLYHEVIKIERNMIKELLFDRISRGIMEEVANEIFDNTTDKELKNGVSNWLMRNIALKNLRAKNEISFDEYNRESSLLLSALQNWLEQYTPPIK